MNIQNFAKSCKTPYIRMMSSWDHTKHKKEYDIRTTCGNFSFEGATAYDETVDFETNQILFKITKSHIVIDTDYEAIYTKLTDFLEDHDRYNINCIPEGFSDI